jgi:uncharacterized protein
MQRPWNELLMEDHQVIDQAIAAIERALSLPADPSRELVARMVDFFSVYVDQCHSQKEEQHVFPLLERLGVPRQGGPLAVMLEEHTRGRELLARCRSLGEAYLRGDRAVLADLRATFSEYAELLKAHFWKENDVLYPMAKRLMSAEDGARVVAGIEAVEANLGPDIRSRYYRLAAELVDWAEVRDLSFGLDRGVLGAILNTLPVELSFVDADDTVRYFSHERSEKIFARTRGVIGLKVQQCHPQKSVHVVNRILADFKAGQREVAEFWIDLDSKKVQIRYFPVRDPNGQYLGCLEVVQDITRLVGLTGQRRLLDEA